MSSLGKIQNQNNNNNKGRKRKQIRPVRFFLLLLLLVSLGQGSWLLPIKIILSSLAMRAALGRVGSRSLTFPLTMTKAVASPRS